MSGEPSLRTTWVLCGIALVLGAALRLAPCFGDLWLDEIWSIERLRGIGGALEIFTAVHHSNNHHLTSLWLFALGDDPSAALARLPSWIAGVASIALMGDLAGRRGRLDAIFASLLAASCFALLHFASEARGYAVTVACALLAQRALVAHLDDRRRWGAPVFAIVAIAGLLAHQIFLFYWAGAMAWSGWRLRGAGGSRWARVRSFAALHAAPLAAWTLLYALDLRFLQVGGGDPHDAAWVAERVIRFTFGAPVPEALSLPAVALLAGLLGLALRRMARRGEDAWIVFAVAIALAPFAVLALLRPEVVAVRYFLIGIAFALLLLASALADAFRAGAAGRLASVALLALFLVGNGVQTARFLEYGRGGYRDALRHMAEQGSGAVIGVGSDHEFRTGLVLRYYARRLSPPRRLLLQRPGVPNPGLPDGPEWWIVHRAGSPAAPPERMRDPSGLSYTLAAVYPHAGISGFHWSLYRRESGSGASERRSTTIPNP